MLATIDWVARRYGVLPSKLLQEGDSIDIILAELGQEYENRQQAIQEAKSKGLPPPAPKMSQSEMAEMLANVDKLKK